MNELFCGFDLGTSSVKAAAFNQNFEQLFEVQKPLSLISKKESQAELDPVEVYEKTLALLEELSAKAERRKKKIDFISFSSALHSLIAVDKNFEPVTGCLTWADSRSQSVVSELEDIYQSRDIYSRTGCPLHAMYMPAKIFWLKKNKPEVFAAADKFISIKEYIIYQLTGEKAVDYSLAGASGMFDIRNFCWEQNLLEFLELREDYFNRAVDGKLVLELRKEICDKLKSEPRVVLGSGDGPLANLGAGAYKNNEFVLTIGTSGAVRAFSNVPVIDDLKRTWCYLLDEDVFLIGGAINNGGLVLQWLRKLLYDDKVEKERFYEDIDHYIKSIEPGSEKLMFLPFLAGERSPNWDASMRGILLGLSLNHDRQQIIKAGLEGIVYRVYAVFNALEDLLKRQKRVIATGGFSRSESWLQLLADIFGREVISLKSFDASTLGAARLGAVARGYYDSYLEIDPDWAEVSIKLPDREKHKKYQQLYSLHEEIYRNNKQVFARLNEIELDC